RLRKRDQTGESRQRFLNHGDRSVVVPLTGESVSQSPGKGLVRTTGLFLFFQTAFGRLGQRACPESSPGWRQDADLMGGVRRLKRNRGAAPAQARRTNRRA